MTRSFETIVAAGPNSAVPHHRPTEAILARGDFVKIDFGALVGGYHSDMTRTFVLGAAATWQHEIYQLVALAQQAGREALVQGAVKKSSQDRDIKDVLEGGEVSVPIDGMDEPRFRREGGTRDMVLPGNKKFIEGDMLPRPNQGGGKGRQLRVRLA